MCLKKERRSTYMEKIIDHLGLYDLLSTFLSGIIIMGGLYLVNIRIPVLFFSSKCLIKHLFSNMTLFLMCSYFVGLIMQELSSFIERNISFLNFRKNSRSNFLNAADDKKKSKLKRIFVKYNVIDNPKELKEYKVIAHNILKNPQITFSQEDCEYVYHYCKGRVEVKNLGSSIHRVNSLYAMSRSLFVSFSLLTISIIIYLVLDLMKCFRINIFLYHVNCIYLIPLIILSFLFFGRCKRYAEYRVRAVMRQYRIIYNEDKK